MYNIIPNSARRYGKHISGYKEVYKVTENSSAQDKGRRNQKQDNGYP